MEGSLLDLCIASSEGLATDLMAKSRALLMREVIESSRTGN